MKLSEYIKQAKAELDEMEENYMKEHVKRPEYWPLDRDVSDWGDEELATRFS